MRSLTRRRKTLPKPEQAPQKPAVPCSVHGDKGDKCDWLRQAVLILIQETKPDEATMARWREAYGPAAQLVCWQLEAVRDEIRETDMSLGLPDPRVRALISAVVTRRRLRDGGRPARLV